MKTICINFGYLGREIYLRLETNFMEMVPTKSTETDNGIN